jgi:hypothetical protein
MFVCDPGKVSEPANVGPRRDIELSRRNQHTCSLDEWLRVAPKWKLPAKSYPEHSARISIGGYSKIDRVWSVVNFLLRIGIVAMNSKWRPVVGTPLQNRRISSKTRCFETAEQRRVIPRHLDCEIVDFIERLFFLVRSHRLRIPRFCEVENQLRETMIRVRDETFESSQIVAEQTFRDHGFDVVFSPLQMTKIERLTKIKMDHTIISSVAFYFVNTEI